MKRIRDSGLDGLSTYGLLKDRGRSEVRGMIDQLEAEGYLSTEQEHMTLRMTALAGQVLYEGKTVQMRVAVEPEEPAPVSGAVKPMEEDKELFESLKELRSKLAKDAGVPAYVVFSNATLVDMAKKKPKTMSQFRKVSGVGEIKAAWYGTAFLKQIQRFMDENQEEG